MKRRRRVAPSVLLSSAFTRFRFLPKVTLLAVRWYLRFGLSCRDLKELLAERGVEVDHVTLHRWVQRFTPLLIDAARPCRHAVGPRWFVGAHVVMTAIAGYGQPEEVVTDRAAAFAIVIDELLPQALHNTVKSANNRVECDHGG